MWVCFPGFSGHRAQSTRDTWKDSHLKWSRRRTASNLSCSFVLSTIETNVKCVCVCVCGSVWRGKICWRCSVWRITQTVSHWCDHEQRIFCSLVVYLMGFSVIVLTLSAETLIFSLHICFHAANAQVFISVQISHLLKHVCFACSSTSSACVSDVQNADVNETPEWTTLLCFYRRKNTGVAQITEDLHLHVYLIIWDLQRWQYDSVFERWYQNDLTWGGSADSSVTLMSRIHHLHQNKVQMVRVNRARCESHASHNDHLSAVSRFIAPVWWVNQTLE